MQFFVANCTKQILQFTYRLPERKAPITRMVGWGRQERLAAGSGGYELSEPDIDAILEQWGKYGLLPVGELESNRHNFQGYLYSIGKPMKAETIKLAGVYREEVLRNKGVEIRKEAAMEMVNTIERETNRPADNYEITVVEEEPSGGYAENQTHVAEGYRASRDQRPNMPEPPTPLKSRRRAA